MNEAVAVYDEYAERQWSRLDDHPCELHVHLDALERHLPTGCRVLDVGAGPGRYSLELARRGHRVVAGDPAPRLVAEARRRADAFTGGDGRVEAVLQLDARDLGGFPEASFDAVVAFGPFYHLALAEDRRRAAREVARVLRPGGVLFASFMPRTFWLSLALQGFVAAEDAPEGQLADLEAFPESGLLPRLRSPQVRTSWFCRIEEIAPLFAAHGIAEREMRASSGIAGPWSRPDLWRRFADRPEAVRRRVLDLLLSQSADPRVLGMSDQVLFVGERRVEGEGRS